MSKGSKRRPSQHKNSYEEGYDRIFKKSGKFYRQKEPPCPTYEEQEDEWLNDLARSEIITHKEPL